MGRGLHSDSDKQRSPHSNVRIVDASGSVAWPNASPIPPSNSKAIVKELFVSFVGWLWIAAVLCTIYLL
jgi:hypothetical protein